MNRFHKTDNFRRTFNILATRKNCRCRWGGGARDKFLICEYDITSRYSKKTYTLCLNYERYWAPRIWVVVPDLLNEQNLPHVYKQQCNQLCLYHSKDFSWNIERDIIQTIMFWSAVWLEFYEIWLDEGKWLGPEAEHTIKKKDTTENLKKHTPSFLRDYPIRY